MTDQLNFLIIMSDEHRKEAVGCVGHPIVKTPVLDAVATGRWIHETGHWDSSATPYASAPQSWMHALRETPLPYPEAADVGTGPST
ncbi:MAG: hypothetical protein GDA40_11770 [Rhodobacteraceae bacterium]|nr:hypothetical protein [Paracoccaceae bacterium]